MTAAHATKTDLVGDANTTGYLSTVDAAVVNGWSAGEIARMLDRASSLVDDLTCRARFKVDEDGTAIDATIAAALRDATCAVVEMWLEVGEDNDVDGLAGESYTVTGYSGLRSPEASGRVLRPLRQAGLLAQPATVGGRL